jgi:hypothetical protein
LEFGSCCVFWFGIWNPEIPKPKISKWWFHILSPFRIWELISIVVWYSKPRNPETQNPKVVVPHPFTFQKSRVVVYGGLVFETLKSRNPKYWIEGPTFPFFAF